MLVVACGCMCMCASTSRRNPFLVMPCQPGRARDYYVTCKTTRTRTLVRTLTCTRTHAGIVEVHHWCISPNFIASLEKQAYAPDSQSQVLEESRREGWQNHGVYNLKPPPSPPGHSGVCLTRWCDSTLTHHIWRALPIHVSAI